MTTPGRSYRDDGTRPERDGKRVYYAHGRAFRLDRKGLTYLGFGLGPANAAKVGVA